jgi:amino acid transporter
MSFYSKLKRFILGKPLPNDAYKDERLNNFQALAVFSSDAISSNAYATEEILKVLVLAGVAGLSISLWISITIVSLLGIVVVSYRQTVAAYPNGGGAYIVATSNWGRNPGLLAAASLMIDYVLTVSVSIASGVENITSLPQLKALQPFSIPLCLGLILLLMIMNLRGIRQTGTAVMVPTYAFIASMLIMIGMGLFHQATGQVHIAPPAIKTSEQLGIFFVLRAFSQGCVALTGVEAISNGVQAFKQPEAKNAQIVTTAMGVILGTIFLGITYLSNVYHIVPQKNESVVAMLAHQIFGDGPIYSFTLIFTLLILILAANTSFSDFPRVASFLANDRFLPQQLQLFGDRLVYSNGIILLSIFASVLIVVTGASVDALIPLYAIGVYTSFTLSQSGMVKHWLNERSEHWQVKLFLNGLGAVATGIVLAIIITAKFTEGAWAVLIAIPLVIALFLAVNRHYKYVDSRLSVKNEELEDFTPGSDPQFLPPTAVVVVGEIHHGTLETLNYAHSIASEIAAVHVDIGRTDRERLQRQWEQIEKDVHLEIIDSPTRSLLTPIVDFVGEFQAKHPDTSTTVIIPVAVTRHWWEELLHNQTAFFLKNALQSKSVAAITTVRYYL